MACPAVAQIHDGILTALQGCADKKAFIDIVFQRGIVMENNLSLPAFIPLSGQQRSDLCDTLLRYLEFHTDQPINIRSLSVLRELYR